MTILTKDDRIVLRADVENCPVALQFDGEDMGRALDTIDALEAERDSIRREVASLAIESVERSKELAKMEAQLTKAVSFLRVSEQELGACEKLLEDHFQIPIDFEHAIQDGIRELIGEIDDLKASQNEWIQRAESAEATRDRVSMMLARALDKKGHDGDPVTFLMEVQRASTLCPPVDEARERTRKAAELFDQILHPNGRCECEDSDPWMCEWCTKECGLCGMHRRFGCGCDSECLGCLDYAERVKSLENAISASHAIASANQNTKVVGGAHAALREIVAVIEGGGE